MKLQRYAGNPIIAPRPEVPWEAAVATNPGVWYDEAAGKVFMLYRAAGDDEGHVVRLALAVSDDGYRFERVGDGPVFGPSADGWDAGCVEDPRLIKIGGWYYVTYAARPFPPGRYWLQHPSQARLAVECPPEFPALLRNNATATGLAITKDFRSWIRCGMLTDPREDDRDVILFPERIGGRYWMLRRPMQRHGPGYGTEHPAIWISSSDDMLHWDEGRLLAKGEYEWEGGKIGGNTPPIRTPHGWLTLYHAVGADKHYRLGALLLDLDDPTVVRYRSRDWLLQPEEPYELEGYYPGVVFPCGKAVIDGTLFVYYGGADKYVGLATCPLGALLDYLLGCPVDGAGA